MTENSTERARCAVQGNGHEACVIGVSDGYGVWSEASQSEVRHFLSLYKTLHYFLPSRKESDRGPSTVATTSLGSRHMGSPIHAEG